MEWAEKGEQRAIAYRKMLEAVLKFPDNGPEKALQKSLQVSTSNVFRRKIAIEDVGVPWKKTTLTCCDEHEYRSSHALHELW